MQAPDVGALQQLEVSCKGGGMTAAWHLAHISVTHPVTQAVTRFDHNEWFDAQHGWTQVSRAGEQLRGDFGHKCVYSLGLGAIFVSWAATDAVCS
jgi:hypothetical protein